MKGKLLKQFTVIPNLNYFTRAKLREKPCITAHSKSKNIEFTYKDQELFFLRNISEQFFRRCDGNN